MFWNNYSVESRGGDSAATEKQYGFIAQDVETVLPELVSFTKKPAVLDSLGKVVYPATSHRALNYIALIAILTQGMQEQQKLIDSLFLLVNAKSTQRFGNNENGTVANQTDVTLANKKIVLDQNSPNPFHDQTTITYEIKTDFNSAAIMFTDMNGDVIKEVSIKEKGKGQLNVFAPDLSNGIYTYYIVVDGKTIYTKKMIKE